MQYKEKRHPKYMNKIVEFILKIRMIENTKKLGTKGILKKKDGSIFILILYYFYICIIYILEDDV